MLVVVVGGRRVEEETDNRENRSGESGKRCDKVNKCASFQKD